MEHVRFIQAAPLKELAGAALKASEAIDQMAECLYEWRDRELALLAPAQRAHYDRLIADGGYIIDALRSAKYSPH